MSKDDIIMEENVNNIELSQDDSGLTLDDFGQGNFVNNPAVGQTIVFEVLKIVPNANTKGKNKDTEKEFDIGLKYKDGHVKRYDIETDLGVYTVKNWEIFFKTLGKDGVLTQYAKTHNKRFTGAKVSITRLLDGGHANYKIDDLAKIIGKTAAEATKYQDEIKKAIKESRLFKIELIN
jgi:hypothetical protein